MKISGSVAKELADFARSSSRFEYEHERENILTDEAHDIVVSLVRDFLRNAQVVDPAPNGERAT